MGVQTKEGWGYDFRGYFRFSLDIFLLFESVRHFLHLGGFAFVPTRTFASFKAIASTACHNQIKPHKVGSSPVCPLIMVIFSTITRFSIPTLHPTRRSIQSSLPIAPVLHPSETCYLKKYTLFRKLVDPVTALPTR